MLHDTIFLLNDWVQSWTPMMGSRPSIDNMRRVATMKLYFSRNPHPRLAVAVAKHLRLDLEFTFASPKAPGEAKKYRHLNPNLLLSILDSPGKALWEADAIACWLSRKAQSQFWRTDDDEPTMWQSCQSTTTHRCADGMSSSDRSKHGLIPLQVFQRQPCFRCRDNYSLAIS